MSVTRTIELSDLTPQELAELFARMFDDEQAAFFNALKPITDKWPCAGWCQQCSQIVEHLDKGGFEVIAKLAEWAADPEGESA